MSQPYTHADHAKNVVIAYYKGDPLGIKRKWVQVRIGRTVCCASIREAWDTPDGVEMWQVDLHGPIYGRMSAPARNVRACQAVDGLCVCVPKDLMPEVRIGLDAKRPAQAETVAASVGLPDGNHGEYLPETVK